MSRTLSQILVDVNSTMDLEAALPTGDELETRTNYAHQAVLDAAAMGQLSEFKAEFLTTTSTLATIPLPSNFREFEINPRIMNTDGSGWTEYIEIDAEDRYDYTASDYFCYVLGNPSEGYNAVFNNIIASSTLSIIHQRYPSGLLTLADVCELPDSQYVARKVESYVLYSRSDDRLQIAEARAEQRLANMMAREMKGPGGQSRNTRAKFRNPLT